MQDRFIVKNETSFEFAHGNTNLCIRGDAMNATLPEMKQNTRDTIFTKLEKGDEIPYELLLLADPSKEVIDQYLKLSNSFIARQDDEIVGIIVLMPLSKDIVEIKNVSVKPGLQGTGIGSSLIENAIKYATLAKYRSICIGTANSSTRQLYLYQKLGFEITGIKKNFFTKNYPDPIYENGIQAKHMLVLIRQL